MQIELDTTILEKDDWEMDDSIHLLSEQVNELKTFIMNSDESKKMEAKWNGGTDYELTIMARLWENILKGIDESLIENKDDKDVRALERLKELRDEVKEYVIIFDLESEEAWVENEVDK